jgi:hypothetical protein
LFDAVFEAFNFMWRTYMRVEDGDLDSNAVAMKKILSAIATEEK